jgi:hypothetical protein
MEADWEFEVGGDAPVIEAHWAGFVDLQRQPERAGHLPEVAQFPAFGEALARLNAADSPVWTSKCDFWPHLETSEYDPDELDAPPGCTAHAMGCFIDLLPKSDQQWALPEMAEKACRRVCGLLSAVSLRCCRADLVIRRAIITSDVMDLGITAYLTSCGETPAAAAKTLEAALATFTDAFGAHSTVK